MADKKGILVIAEQHSGQLDESCLGVISEGRRIADKLGEESGTVLIGSQAAGLIDSVAHRGADTVYLLDHPALAEYTGASGKDLITAVAVGLEAGAGSPARWATRESPSRNGPISSGRRGSRTLPPYSEAWREGRTS